jgi:hypothetical protein
LAFFTPSSISRFCLAFFALSRVSAAFRAAISFGVFLYRVLWRFPRSGCEQLLGQIFNLGVEAHDDLCDGLVWLLQGLVSQGLELPKIHLIEK